MQVMWASNLGCFSWRSKCLMLFMRQFYTNASSTTLLPLYQSLVRPHLEYASSVWNPHTQKDVKSLGNVEKFALRMITKQWDLGYQELIEMVSLPSLETRRLQASLCTFTKLSAACASFHLTLLFRDQTTARGQIGNYCYTSHLLIQMHSCTRLCLILLMSGTHFPRIWLQHLFVLSRTMSLCTYSSFFP